MSKPVKTPIKVCIFDAFGTLFKVRIPTEEVEALCPGKGDSLLAIWRQKQLEYTWLRGLMDSYIPFDQITEQALQYATDLLGGSDSAALFELLMPIYRTPVCFEEVPACLAWLRQRGYTRGILSNGTADMLQAGVRNARLEDQFDYIFSVEEAGTFKPAPEVYRLPIDEIGVSRENVLFLSSNPWDIAGAGHFGFATAWINRAGKPMDRLGVQPDLILTDLAQLSNSGFL